MKPGTLDRISTALDTLAADHRARQQEPRQRMPASEWSALRQATMAEHDAKSGGPLPTVQLGTWEGGQK